MASTSSFTASSAGLCWSFRSDRATTDPLDRSRARGRVLVCERNAFIALDLQTLIEVHGFQVDVCVPPVGDLEKFLAERYYEFAVIEWIPGDWANDPLRLALTRNGVPFAIVASFTLREIPVVDVDTPLIMKPFSTSTVDPVLLALSSRRRVESSLDMIEKRKLCPQD